MLWVPVAHPWPTSDRAQHIRAGINILAGATLGGGTRINWYGPYTAISVILLHECHHITNLLRQSAEAVANATHLEVLRAEFMPHLLSWSSVKTELQVQERELCHTCARQEGVG